MLHYNAPYNIKQMQEAQPLTIDESEIAVKYLNECLFNKNKDTDEYKLLKRLIYSYENMQIREAVNMNVNYEIVESKINSQQA